MEVVDPLTASKVSVKLERTETKSEPIFRKLTTATSKTSKSRWPDNS